MITQWLTALFVTALAAGARSASVQVRDIVVAGPKSPEPSPKTPQRPYEPIKLTEMDVRSDIRTRYARTSVKTHVVNSDSRSQEATFSMLLPDTAFISEFVMTLDGKSYKAYVKEKEEAQKIYNDAKSQGIGAAHVATSARDSNQFTVSVNVEGNSTAIFVLIYEELLVRSNGIYNHDINLHPGNLVPNLKVVVNIKEPQVISTLRVPELRTGNDVAATENDPQNKNAVIEKDDDDQGVTITFKPDLEEQKRLAKVYLEKTKDKDSSNRYSRNTETTQTSTVLGQFVVQYDLEQPCTGEVFISDGYFAHFFAPTSLPPLGKNVIFVLDISGSMIGRKIEQLKSAMNTILSDLNEYDRFSIVVFNSIVTVQDLKDADLPAPKTPIYFPTVNSSSKNVTLVPPSVASPENIAKAKKIVNKLVANGGTNIYEALLVGLNIKDKGVEWDTEKKSTSNKGCSRCNSGWEDGWDVEWYEPEEIHNKLEPVIIFLTDGQATVGETNTNRIIANITKKNFESEPASIYTLPLGRDADTTFLRKLALRNNGFSQYLYEDYDTGNQLVDMYRKVSSPLLSNVKFHYPSEQIQIGTLSRNQYHIINAGSEIVVVGKLDDDASEYDISPYVTGYYGSEDGLSRIPYEVYPRVTVKCGTNQLPLERLWAYLNIKQLLDERDATDDEAVKTSAEKKALNIALKYEFVTPLTSLVVVKPNATNAVDLESADKQPSSGFLGGAQFAASPAFVSNAAVSRAAPAMLSKTAVRRAPGPAIQAFIPAPAPAVAADALQAPDVSTIPSPGPAPGPAPVLAPEAVPAPTPDPAPASPLDKYHLQNFKWTSSILNKNISALVFENNGIQITLDLTEDINVPKEAGGDAQCSTWWGQTSVGANTGNSCVYLTRCRVAQTLTVDEYSNSYCVINNSYAGVCCPNNEVDKP